MKYAYYNGDNAHDYITKGKRYLITEEGDRYFITMSDTGTKMYCLKDACGHLNLDTWEFEEVGDEVTATAVDPLAGPLEGKTDIAVAIDRLSDLFERYLDAAYPKDAEDDA